MAVVGAVDDVDDSVAVRLDGDNRDVTSGNEATDPQACLEFVKFCHMKRIPGHALDPIWFSLT